MLPKSSGNREVTVWDGFRYVQTALDFQVPCAFMCSSGTPWWKAQVLAALLKEWNYKVGVKVQCLRNFLQVISGHSEYYKALFVVNHKERVIVRTRIGMQKFFNLPSAGMAIVCVSVLF